MAAPLLGRIQAHAERNLDDPELSLAALALRHGISLRHLHRLFAAKGTTAAEWLLQRRLERCRAELAHPAQRYESITAIALRWGMSDSSTFSKAFKRRYGLTPSQYRSRAAT
jgi:AraC-like DNA-binding protein